MRVQLSGVVLLSVLASPALSTPIAKGVPITEVDGEFLASSSSSSPCQPPFLAPSNTDVAILNYALTLEHLQSAFYTSALATFNEHAFIASGYTLKDRERFVEIAKHEKEHVAFLERTLGGKATKPCAYEL